LKIEAAGIPSPSSSMPWGKSGIFSLIFFYSQTLAGLAAYPLTHWSTFCCNSRTTHSFLGGGVHFSLSVQLQTENVRTCCSFSGEACPSRCL
jgi:hypothetical protein